ncbi:MAG: L-glutamine synthetase [Xanthobacteraceae bacterium]|nr:L-glutamine synthetase [Xanthobacteraceae bacterium]
MPPASGFIARHGLWTDAQWQAADEIKARIEQHNLTLIRVAWPDTHGASKAKTVTVPAFLNALVNGYNINVATTTLDSAGARTFSSFVPGGGMGLKEMSGSPNITIVPDPTTFRVLPWAPGVGWVLCDEYFNSGMPYFFSARQLLRQQLAELSARGQSCRVGLEVEWYLLKVAEDRLGEEHIGMPGVRGRPIATAPVEPGYSYHSESNMDLMQPVFSALATAFEKIRLPLRSLENEWGPGQVECTFAAQDALAAADDLVLFRTATRQICRRMGYFATFMCRPALKGFYSSGWHLHLSLTDTTSGNNLFMPTDDGTLLSPLGQNFLGGVLHNANAATAFATPTVNGYRRFRPNSLAPDRASWGFDHRGAMIRVLGGTGDSATRLENRVGEPSANPYLYILSQLVAGRDGVERGLDPGPQDDEPYAAARAPLPKTLIDALDVLDQDALFRKALGDVYVDYFVKLKRTEAGRFMRYLEESGAHPGDEPTVWEHNEYFDFF